MRRVAHIFLPLVAFGLGVAGGAWYSIESRAAAFAAGIERRLAETVIATPAPSADVPRAFSTDDEMLTAIMSAVAEEKPLRRAHRLHGLIGRLSPGELASLFARAVQVDDSERRGVVLAALLARWAAIDPAGAAEAVRPYRERHRASGGSDWRGLDAAVNHAWARAQPDLVLAEAMAAPDARWAGGSARSALESLAEGDPARQLETLARLPASRLRADLCEQAIQTLAEKDSATAEAHLGLVSDPQKRAHLHATILGKLAERDPAAALARLAELAPDLTAGIAGTQLVSAVLSAAAKRDASSALAAVDGLPEELRARARGAALVGWAHSDPIAALEWAASHGVDVAGVKAINHLDSSGGSWQPLMGVAFLTDHAKTLAWLRTQPPSPQRDALLREGMGNGTVEQISAIYAELTPHDRAAMAGQYVDSLFRDDPKRAEVWVNDLPAGAARAAAVHDLVLAQAGNAPDRLDALAAAWPAGPDRDAALCGVAASLTYADPRRALDFARRVTGVATREEALERIAHSWSFRDATAARAWIASAAELSSEQKRVLLREFDER